MIGVMVVIMAAVIVVLMVVEMKASMLGQRYTQKVEW